MKRRSLAESPPRPNREIVAVVRVVLSRLNFLSLRFEQRSASSCLKCTTTVPELSPCSPRVLHIPVPWVRFRHDGFLGERRMDSLSRALRIIINVYLGNKARRRDVVATQAIVLVSRAARPLRLATASIEDMHCHLNDG